MSKMLSGAEVGAREAEGEQDGKPPLGKAKNCRELFDTCALTARNCALLTLAISSNFAPFVDAKSAVTDQFSAASWQKKRSTQKTQNPFSVSSRSRRSGKDRSPERAERVEGALFGFAPFSESRDLSSCAGSPRTRKKTI